MRLCLTCLPPAVKVVSSDSCPPSCADQTVHNSRRCRSTLNHSGLTPGTNRSPSMLPSLASTSCWRGQPPPCPIARTAEEITASMFICVACRSACLDWLHHTTTLFGCILFYVFRMPVKSHVGSRIGSCVYHQDLQCALPPPHGGHGTSPLGLIPL